MLVLLNGNFFSEQYGIFYLWLLLLKKEKRMKEWKLWYNKDILSLAVNLTPKIYVTFIYFKFSGHDCDAHLFTFHSFNI